MHSGCQLAYMLTENCTKTLMLKDMLTQAENSYHKNLLHADTSTKFNITDF